MTSSGLGIPISEFPVAPGLSSRRDYSHSRVTSHSRDSSHSRVTSRTPGSCPDSWLAQSLVPIGPIAESLVAQALVPALVPSPQSRPVPVPVPIPDSGCPGRQSAQVVECFEKTKCWKVKRRGEGGLGTPECGSGKVTNRWDGEAESQWIVAARLLYHLQYLVPYLSRLQRIHLPDRLKL